MTMQKLLSSTAILALVFLACAASVTAGSIIDLRGKRYGEVLLGTGGVVVSKELDVYNTIGLNDCPEELWSKLDPAAIKKETGAKVVRLNGPRYWVMDGMTNSNVSPDIRNFGGIEMRRAGVLAVSISDLMHQDPYTVHKVARQTTWVYQAGKPVYQLISPDGSVFFMQSFSAQKKSQDMQDLAKLGSALTLPKGWQFRTLTLKKDYLLTATDGMAYVTRDDFANTYQKSTAQPNDVL